MKRQIPLFITFFFGTTLFLQYFIPLDFFQKYYETMLQWSLGVASLAVALGVISLTRHHIRKVRKKENLFYSSVTLISLILMSIIGLFFGIEQGSLFQTIFLNVQVPLQATMFSILAFYIASAAYRAFRARNLEATLLLLSAFVVMLGIISIGDFIYPHFSDFSQWILDVPNLAAKRGIEIGVGLGIISTAMKIILGIERNWLGG